MTIVRKSRTNGLGADQGALKRIIFQPLDIETVVKAYRFNRTLSDMVQGRFSNGWGPVWAIPSGSVSAAEGAGRQMTRCRAQRVRHFRRTRLRDSMASGKSSQGVVEAVVLTELPSGDQVVARLMDGRILCVSIYLEDEVLAALRASYSSAGSSYNGFIGS